MPPRVKRTGRVSEVIVRRVKKQISEGRLGPGEKLPAERDMAKQFKTSRVSVREAYRSLEELGLLLIRRGAEGGAFIGELDHGPVMRSLSLMLGLGKTSHQELTEARMLIEPPIARLAALRGGADDVERLEQVLIQEEEALHSSGPFRATGSKFHRALADCARNLPLAVLMNALADLTAGAASALDVSARARHRQSNCAYHRRIFEAVRRHDDHAAYTIMVQHVGDIQGRVNRTIKHQIATGAVASPPDRKTSRGARTARSHKKST